VHPSLNELVTREPGFAAHMVGLEPQLAFTGANLPLLLKGFGRITNEGSYLNAYACDLNLQGFLPGFNDVIPIIVDAASPGPGTQYSPKCRNMADG
jgi:phospholipid/cholesterol/gamma-HCH transport system substrate-binding protein